MTAKKIISLILAITAAFVISVTSLVSCGRDDNSDNDGVIDNGNEDTNTDNGGQNNSDDTPAPHEAYTKALSDACLTSKMESSISTKYGTLTAEYEAEYNNGTVSVTFTRTSMGAIDGNTTADDIIIEETGSATINSDGSSDGKLGVLAGALLARRINLSGVTEYEDTGSELSFTVKSADSKTVFGGECEYDVDVKITLTDGNIEKISLSYDAVSGSTVAECKYSY